jgi:hypothetical protein
LQRSYISGQLVAFRGTAGELGSGVVEPTGGVGASRFERRFEPADGVLQLGDAAQSQFHQPTQVVESLLGAQQCETSVIGGVHSGGALWFRAHACPRLSVAMKQPIKMVAWPSFPLRNAANGPTAS